MAKLEMTIDAKFDELREYIHREIMQRSVTASLEEESRWEVNGVCCWVGVFERYSAFGKNRTSINVTLVGQDGNVRLIGAAAGGSSAMFFKINTIGEEAFLDTLREAMAAYADR